MAGIITLAFVVILTGILDALSRTSWGRRVTEWAVNEMCREEEKS